MIGKVNIPSLSFLIFYVIGIVISRQFPFFFDSVASHIGFVILICFTSFLLYLSLRDYKSYAGLATIGSLIVFALFGYYRTANYHALSHSDHYSYIDQADILIGTVSDLPTQGKHIKCQLEVSSSGRSVDSMFRASGAILVYFELDSISSTLAPGDIVLCEVNPRSVRKNANPHVFDYKQYLDNRNIHFQGFIKADKWIRVARGALPWYWQKATTLRKYSLSVIDQHIDSIDNKAVLSAMLLGVRSLISDELYDAYTDTGAVHVLAVSGLHVGIFTIILYWFFGLFRINHPWYKWLKLVLTLLVVWSFVLVTGAAPAVTRAATMSTLVIIAHSFNKQVNTYNVLSVTALAMLLYNPLMLYQASFQFSFLALWSILFFMPILIGHYTPEHSWFQKLIAFFYVSIAAQVLVLPLTIFYFHKMASYFWVSGLFVIPAAFAILCLGLLLLLFDVLGQYVTVFDWLNANVISTLLEWIIGANNYLIACIQKLPLSAIDGLWLSPTELIILYIGIVLSMIAFAKHKGWVLICAMIVFLGFTIQRAVWNHHIGDNRSVYIYDVYGRSLIDIIYQDQVYSILNDDSEELASKNTFIRGNNRYYNGAREADGLPEFSRQKGAFFSVGNTVFLFAGHDSIYQYKSMIPVDYAIIQHNYVADIDKMRNQFDIRNVIVDGTNSYQAKRAVRKDCYTYKLPYIDTQYGAIEIKY